MHILALLVLFIVVNKYDEKKFTSVLVYPKLLTLYPTFKSVPTPFLLSPPMVYSKLFTCTSTTPLLEWNKTERPKYAHEITIWITL